MSSSKTPQHWLAASLPVIIAAASTAYTIHLVQHPDPQLRYSAAWLPLFQLFALWILVGPVQKVLNRPGGTWSVSWLSGAGFSEREEEGWNEALVQGGIVSVMSVAWVRTFVGLDVPSAVALLVSSPRPQQKPLLTSSRASRYRYSSSISGPRRASGRVLQAPLSPSVSPQRYPSHRSITAPTASSCAQCTSLVRGTAVRTVTPLSTSSKR